MGRCRFIFDDKKRCNNTSLENNVLCEEHLQQCNKMTYDYHDCMGGENECKDTKDYDELKRIGSKYNKCSELRKKVIRQCYKKDDNHELAYYTDKHKGIDCFAKACDNDNYNVDSDEINLEKYTNCKKLHDSAKKKKKKMMNLAKKLNVLPPYYEIFNDPNNHDKKLSEYDKKIIQLKKTIKNKEQIKIEPVQKNVEQPKRKSSKKKKKPTQKSKTKNDDLDLEKFYRQTLFEKAKYEEEQLKLKKERQALNFKLEQDIKEKQQKKNKESDELFNLVRYYYKLNDTDKFMEALQKWLPGHRIFTEEESNYINEASRIQYSRQIDNLVRDYINKLITKDVLKHKLNLLLTDVLINSNHIYDPIKEFYDASLKNYNIKL